MMKHVSRAFAALLSVLAVSANVSAQAPVPDSLTLEAAGQTLVERNLSIEASRLEVNAARQARVFARLFPRARVTVSGENLGVFGPTPFGNLYEAGVSVTQPIPLGDRRGAREELAESSITLAEARLEIVLRERLFEMRKLYFRALLARERVKIEEENSANFGELLRYGEVRLSEGDIPPGEVVKLRLEKIRYDAALAEARLDLRTSLIRLLELLGSASFDGLDAIELREPFSFRAYDLDIVSLRRDAAEKRPEIREAEARVEQARAALKLERTRGKGELEPYVGYRRVGPDNTLVAGVTIPLPIGERNQTAVVEADAELKIAETVLTQLRNRTAAEIESAYLAFVTAREQVSAFETGILRQADESRDISTLAYREGAIDLIELLEAQRTRTKVLEDYYKGLLAYYTQVFSLELLTGTDIKR